MSSFLRKKLHLCFSSSGGISPAIPSSPIIVSNHNAPSSHHHHHTPSIFINNFNSLYDHLSVSSPLHRRHSSDNPAGLFSSSNRLDNEEQDEDSAVVSKILSGGTAIMKHIDSPDPYRDFGRSMREMVEARDLTRDVAADREYLHELLFCYLSLNPKHTHKFIVSAFADTLLWLLSPSSSSSENYFLLQSN
ncbi:hypothetical protein CARUB_v10006932mg [Capsella rubella]|uniref:Transcription repressor n=1 Tax=Capsella rubella TaxID=81985 RepID=R0GNF3_9BRAS|nr:transcription repressor OFP11 [Capsella rubella]EOA18394.1 hypothetical protein CARUB_v10006932mg [Capsella rubella]